MIHERMQELFKANMPETLYMHPSELAARLGGSAKVWETFLERQDIQILIEVNMARYLEIESRKALQKFTDGGVLNSQELQGLKAILEKSKILQERANIRPTVVLTYMPKVEEDDDANSRTSVS